MPGLDADVPGLLWERGRAARDLPAGARALAAAARSAPAAVALGGVLLAAALAAAGAAAVGIGAAAAARAVRAVAHRLAHRRDGAGPEAEAALACVAAVAGVAAGLGAGPVGVGIGAGLAAIPWLGRSRGALAGGAAVLAAFAFGPPADWLARAAVAPLARPEAFAAWRVERREPLPGDGVLLERAARAGDPLARLALARLRLLEGDPGGALAAAPAPEGAGTPRWARLRAEHLRASVALAAGDLDAAIEGYERVRAELDAAPVLFDLALAYGRALELDRQAALYLAARSRDPRAVAAYAEAGTGTFHELVMPLAAPLGAHLAAALAPSEPAAALARALRARWLGVPLDRVPWWSFAVAAAALLALAPRRAPACARCSTPICVACPPEVRAAGLCPGCRILFATGERGSVPASARAAELERQRRRARRLRRAALAADLALPGAGAILEGRWARGGARLAAAGAAVALAAVAPRWPADLETGRIAADLGTALALALAAAAWLPALARLRGAADGALEP